MGATPAETCTWCGAAVEPEDGFRAHEPAGERYAVFCRLEHVVPWELKSAHWEPAPAGSPGIPGRGTKMPGSEETGWSQTCSHCEAALEETAVVLVRHRGEHRIADGFCSAAHMAAWARAGGRWQ